MTMRVLAVVTARGGSKGFPGKNLAILGGKSLLRWSIEAALQATRVTDVLLSTDDEAMMAEGERAGAWVPFRRPAELSRDDSPHVPVVRHALEEAERTRGREYDAVLLLQPTSPLRTAADLDGALTLLEESGVDAVVGVTEAPAHPRILRATDDAGFLTELLPAPEGYARRQEFSEVLAINGAVYAVRREALLREGTFLPKRTLPWRMPRERSVDIDDAADLRLAEFYLRERDQ